jgi:hypothetical protein
MSNSDENDSRPTASELWLSEGPATTTSTDGLVIGAGAATTVARVPVPESIWFELFPSTGGLVAGAGADNVGAASIVDKFSNHIHTYIIYLPNNDEVTHNDL